MSVSISEICENTKLAREMALMGNYDTSGVYYQGVIQQIHRLLTTIGDATRKGKWQVVQHQIAQEFEKVKATSNTLQLFKIDTHGERLVGMFSSFFLIYDVIFILLQSFFLQDHLAYLRSKNRREIRLLGPLENSENLMYGHLQPPGIRMSGHLYLLQNRSKCINICLNIFSSNF